MQSHQKVCFFCLLISLGWHLDTSRAATKLLYNISMTKSEDYPVERYEQAVLEDADSVHQSIHMNGSYLIEQRVAGDAQRIYKISVIYTADKSGFWAKFTITLEPQIDFGTRLGIQALKSAAG